MTSLGSYSTAQLKTSDFEEIREAYTGWDHEYVQLNKGGFHGGLTLFQTENLQLSHNVWGNKIRYRGTTPKGSYAAGLTLDQAYDGKWQGVSSGFDDVILQRPEQAAEYFSADRWDAIVLSVPDLEMDKLISVLSGRRGDGVDLLQGQIRLDREAAMDLREMGQAFFSSLSVQLGDTSETPIDEAALTLMAEQIKRRFVLALLGADSCDAIQLSQSKSDHLVRQAEEFAMSSYGRTVGILDLCTELGVAERSLHAAFNKSLGTSPAAYLRCLRLNKTYKQLRTADPKQVKVKQIALANGFAHFGQFSNLFRLFFNELPSKTLQRT